MTDTTSDSGTDAHVRDSHQRLHSLVYSVVYPAFLGTFLVGLLLKSNAGAGPPWGVLLACYFTLQQIEGSLSGSRGYGFWRTVFDGIEIALMVAAFGALDLFPDTPPLALAKWLGLGTAGIIFAIFLLPVLVRFVFGRAKLVGNTPNAAFYWLLTTMSIAAAILSRWYPEWWAFYFIAGFLGIYLIAFQIWNEPITDQWELSSLRRIPKRVSTTLTKPQNDLAEKFQRWADAAKASAGNAETAAKRAEAAAKTAEAASRNPPIASPVDPPPTNGK